MIIDIPDDEKSVYVFHGKRLIYKKESGLWQVLETPCNMCGECCKRVSTNWWLGVNEQGWCKYLKEYVDGTFICGANDTPFHCQAGDFANEDWCCVSWRTL